MARQSRCRKCGKRGHIARECTSEGNTQTAEDDTYDSETEKERESALFNRSMSSLTINPHDYDSIPVNVSIPEQEVTPVKKFEDLPLEKQLQKNITSCGYTKPTALQRYALPVICKGKDVLICGGNMSGETATFVLPMINLIKLGRVSAGSNHKQTPIAIVIVPTNVLAVEIQKEVIKLSQAIPCKPQVAYESANTSVIEQQRKSIESGCNIIIGTPVRVKQLIMENTISLEKVKLLVLFEADEMLPDEFEVFVTAPGLLPNYDQRQTILISSTHTKGINAIAKKLLKDNHRLVTVAVQNTQTTVKVSVAGYKPPVGPIKRFTDLALGPQLQENITRSGYKKPTPVQKYALPIICNGKDVMACAQTGTGKTAAFVLPMIKLITEIGSTSSTQYHNTQTPEAIVITPTRELAIQIDQDIQRFANKTHCKPRLAYGGTHCNRQRDHIRQGCNILIGTPGRIKQFIEDDTISFENIKFFVLDEADKMLDMGFKSDIDFFAGDPDLPPKHERQTLLFSATYPEGVQEVAKQFLDEDYRFITVGEIGSAQPDINQFFLKVESSQKTPNVTGVLKKILGEKLDNGKLTKTLVFVQTKRIAGDLADILFDSLYDWFSDDHPEDDLHVDFGVTSIHGNKTQSQREKALGGFRDGTYRVLVATAVAARGLDIAGVTHVINYDMPDNRVQYAIEEYVNKIGRTGRAGNIGTAVSFFQPDRDTRLARPLVQILSDAHQDVPEWLEKLAESSPGGGKTKKPSKKSSNDAYTASTHRWDNERGPAGEELWGNQSD